MSALEEYSSTVCLRRSPLRPCRLASASISRRFRSSSPRVMMSPLTLAAIASFDADLFGRGLQGRVLEQVADRFGHWAISILQFLFGTVASVGIRCVCDLAVGAEALIFVADVLDGDADIQAQIQCRMDL